LAFAVLPEQDGVVTVGKTGPVTIWHPRKGTTKLPVPGDTANALAISPDLKHTALAIPTARDHRGNILKSTLKVLDTVTGQMAWEVRDLTGAAQSLTFTQDGSFVVLAGTDKTVRVYTRMEGKPQALLNLDHSALSVVTRNKDLLYASGNSLWTWNPSTPDIAPTAVYSHTERIDHMRMSPTGETVALAANGRLNATQTATILNTRDWRVNTHLTTATSMIRAFAFTPDGRTLAVSFTDRKVRLYHVPTGQELAVLESGGVLTSRLEFLNNGRSLLAFAGTPNGAAFTLWDSGKD
jgi:WD40 repeat protein